MCVRPWLEARREEFCIECFSDEAMQNRTSQRSKSYSLTDRRPARCGTLRDRHATYEETAKLYCCGLQTELTEAGRIAGLLGIMSVRIEAMTETDWPGVAEIWREGIARGHATFTAEPVASYA